MYVFCKCDISSFSKLEAQLRKEEDDELNRELLRLSEREQMRRDQLAEKSKEERLAIQRSSATQEEKARLLAEHDANVAR